MTVPDHVRRILYSEIVIARASAYSTEQWVSIICERIESQIQWVGGWWTWKPPIVPSDDEFEPVPQPGCGARSDVPPTAAHAEEIAS